MTVDLANISGDGCKTIIVDIDGVLAIEKGFPVYTDRPAVNDAAEALKLLRRKGYRIILHTSRIEAERKVTIAWLEENGMEYDGVVFGKPRGALYIDDRGYRFSGWKQFFEEVKLWDSSRL